MSVKKLIRSTLFIIAIYSNLVFSNSQIKVPLSSKSRQLTAKLRANQPKGKIVGGKECDIKDRAYVVSMRTRADDDHFCGGSLISYDWVLSAAHCYGKLHQAHLIHAAIGYSYNDQSKTQRIGAQGVRIHPDYDSRKHIHDIAMVLLLYSASTVGVVIGLIKLPTKRLKDSLFSVCSHDEFAMAGWGETRIIEEGQYLAEYHFSKNLKCVTLRYISNADCQFREKWFNETFFRDNVMCVTDLRDGHGSCIGDSGGPLVCDDVQYGVLSYGYGCGWQNRPIASTRVDRYLDFIYENLRPTGRKQQGSSGWHMSCNSKLLMLLFFVLLL